MTLRAAKRLGVILLNDSEANVAGLTFVGGTLWADGRLAGKDAAPLRETGERITMERGEAKGLITSADEAACICAHAISSS